MNNMGSSERCCIKKGYCISIIVICTKVLNRGVGHTLPTIEISSDFP